MFDQRQVSEAIRKQLVEADPIEETRNKFPLYPPSKVADCELRAGDFRVLYRIEEIEGESMVIIAVIGKKERNKLIVEGKELRL